MHRLPHILIVDDESSIRGLLGRIFSRAGFDVTLAGSAVDAMALCETRAFDVVLSDVHGRNIRFLKSDLLPFRATFRQEVENATTE